MIAEERRPQLLLLAQRIAERLSRVRTPTGGDRAYDRSKLAILWRFLQARLRNPEAQRTQPFARAVADYLQRLPGSHHAAISRSARPQLDALAHAVRDIVPSTRNEEELVHVLRWADRLMSICETPQNAARRPAQAPGGGRNRPPGDGPRPGGRRER